MLSGGWPEEVVRHDEIGRITVCDTLGGGRITWLEFFDTAHKRFAAVKTPMPELVSDRKTLAAVGTALVDGNNGHVVMANDPRLASIEWSIAHARSNMERDCLKIDFAWLRDA